MKDKENQFWDALGRWWQSDSGGSSPNQEFGQLADSSANLGREIFSPQNPIFTEANTDAALFLVMLLVGGAIVFKGGKHLLGLDWYSLCMLIALVCAISMFVSEIWRLYINPFVSCLV